MCGRDDMPSLSSSHTPGIINSPASSPVIGRRKCSSGESYRWPISGEEVELGEEELRGSTKIKEDRVRELSERVKRRTAVEVCWL
ncbi:unnamed protein product [Staurois parvus]|uniref:Uncharacterized protein n=1 Tax=Staurois parvus TaxID=386267 RepID=A0ABN9HN25_9NEOB|nr:unnamed protein product [Staurois parvus]